MVRIRWVAYRSKPCLVLEIEVILQDDNSQQWLHRVDKPSRDLNQPVELHIRDLSFVKYR